MGIITWIDVNQNGVDALEDRLFKIDRKIDKIDPVMGRIEGIPKEFRKIPENKGAVVWYNHRDYVAALITNTVRIINEEQKKLTLDYFKEILYAKKR